jgi:hypothetical protein
MPLFCKVTFPPNPLLRTRPPMKVYLLQLRSWRRECERYHAVIGNTEDALHLIRTHALLGFDSQIDRDEPFAKRQVRIVPDVARCY